MFRTFLTVFKQEATEFVQRMCGRRLEILLCVCLCVIARKALSEGKVAIFKPLELTIKHHTDR